VPVDNDEALLARLVLARLADAFRAPGAGDAASTLAALEALVSELDALGAA
jgi:hypothetical protein